MIQDNVISAAVSRIVQRSERQEDILKVVDSFVDTGILEQVDNDNNQILYGRRGTGKTHIFRYLETKRLESPREAVLYLDCRKLGSSAQYTDASKPLPVRCVSLFQDILQLLSQKLLEELIARTQDDDRRQEKGFDLLGRLQNAILHPKKVYVETSMNVTNSQIHTRSAELEVSQGGFHGKFGKERASEGKTEQQFDVRTENKVIFPEINSILNELIESLDIRLLVLFDEWSSLPADIQPYLAELLKRGVIPINSITVKIAALEYRSNFFISTTQGNIGLELGSDVSANIDIDDYYVFDKNSEEVTRFFGDVLFQHLKADLPPDHLQKNYSVANSDQFIQGLFSTPESFQELVRASEGVIRDLINIFTKAYFEAKKTKSEKIGKPTVVSVSQQWYEQG